MKLISEQWSDEVDYLIEEDPKTGKKHAFIQGIMLQTNVKNKNGHEKVTEKSPRPLNTTVLLEISPRISWKRRFCELESPNIEKFGTRNRKF